MSLLDLYEARDICQISYNKNILKVCIYLLKGEARMWTEIIIFEHWTYHQRN